MRDAEFERLYEEHARGLFSFLAARTGDASLAEDLVADTFERALRARRRFDPRRGGRKAWLYAIALNLVRDQARRRDAEHRALERVAAPPALEEGDDAILDHDAIWRCIGVLSAEERDAIALRYGAGLTVPEIARATGERRTTVEGRVYRALRKLREALEP